VAPDSTLVEAESIDPVLDTLLAAVQLLLVAGRRFVLVADK